MACINAGHVSNWPCIASKCDATVVASMKPKKNEVLSLKRLQELTADGWTFRQRQLYSHGLPGDVPVVHYLAGVMWARKGKMRY